MKFELDFADLMKIKAKCVLTFEFLINLFFLFQEGGGSDCDPCSGAIDRASARAFDS